MGEWRKINKGNSNSTTWKPVSMGESVQGIYTEKRTGVGKNSSIVYVLTADDGARIDIWDSSALNLLFNDPENPVHIGEEIKLTYRGTRVNKKTGRTFKVFDMDARAVDADDKDDAGESEPF